MFEHLSKYPLTKKKNSALDEGAIIFNNKNTISAKHDKIVRRYIQYFSTDSEKLAVYPLEEK
jgi:hypothetical protein